MEDQDTAWQTMERVSDLIRRRKWIRTKKCVDAKVQDDKPVGFTSQSVLFKRYYDDLFQHELMATGDGWEYAKTSRSVYHPTPKKLDMVRRRRWMRKMIADGVKESAAIFNLDKPLIVS